MTIHEMKQSYKQSYTDNVELSIFNCGREQCQPGHTWGPGVRDHYLIHLVVAGKGVYQVNGASHTLQEGDLFLAKPPPMRPTRGSITGSVSTARAPISLCSRHHFPRRTPYTTAGICRPRGKRCTTSIFPAGRSLTARQ